MPKKTIEKDNAKERLELGTVARLGFEAVTIGAIGGIIIYLFKDQLRSKYDGGKADGLLQHVIDGVRQYYSGEKARTLDRVKNGPMPKISMEVLVKALANVAPELLALKKGYMPDRDAIQPHIKR